MLCQVFCPSVKIFFGHINFTGANGDKIHAGFDTPFLNFIHDSCGFKRMFSNVNTMINIVFHANTSI